MMQELLKPAPGSKPLSFESPYSTNYLTQVLYLDFQCHHASIHAIQTLLHVLPVAFGCVFAA